MGQGCFWTKSQNPNGNNFNSEQTHKNFISKISLLYGNNVSHHTVDTVHRTEWCYMEILHLPAQVGVSDDHYPVLRHVRTLSPTRVYALWHVYSSWLPTTGVVVWARYRYLPLGVLSGSGHRTAGIHSRKHTMRMTFNAKNICLISICSYVFKHHSVIAFFGNQLLLLLLFLA